MDRWLPGKKVFLLWFGHQLVTPRNTVASRDGDRGSAVQTSSCLQRHRLHHIRSLNSTTLLGSGQLRVSSEVPPMPPGPASSRLQGLLPPLLGSRDSRFGPTRLVGHIGKCKFLPREGLAINGRVDHKKVIRID